MRPQPESKWVTACLPQQSWLHLDACCPESLRREALQHLILRRPYVQGCLHVRTLVEGAHTRVPGDE